MLEGSGIKKEAMKIYKELIDLGEGRQSQRGEIDFFAKFGKEMTENQVMVLSYLMIALGHLGLGEENMDREYFEKSLSADVY
ncbi:MAG: hypothetical protein GY790_05010 [Bacteroidetes bacterium]|nr:hypothetical protein [Bacteroidota bacterium]